MTDRPQTADRFSISDKTSLIRAQTETGMKNGWEDIFHQEELAGDEGATAHERIKGGGVWGIDLLFDNPENADPELIALYKDYLFDRYHVKIEGEGLPRGLEAAGQSEEYLKTDFADWLQKPADKKDLGLRIHLENIAEEPPEAGRYDWLVKLNKLWEDKDTRVIYQLSEGTDDKKDSLIFENQKLGKRLEVGIEVFNKALKKSQIRARITRPWDNERAKTRLQFLQHLRIGEQTFQGEEIKIKYPSVNLNINQKQTEKRLEKPERNLLNKFLELIREPEKIFAFGLGSTGNKIDCFALKQKDGSSVVLPIWIFRYASGLSVFNSGTQEGLSIPLSEGRRCNIIPSTSTGKKEEILRRFRINGYNLPDRAKYVEARRDSKQEKFIRVPEG